VKLGIWFAFRAILVCFHTSAVRSGPEFASSDSLLLWAGVKAHLNSGADWTSKLWSTCKHGSQFSCKLTPQTIQWTKERNRRKCSASRIETKIMPTARYRRSRGKQRKSWKMSCGQTWSSKEVQALIDIWSEDYTLYCQKYSLICLCTHMNLSDIRFLIHRV